MELYDQHLHSWHSFDCKSDPRANVQAALANGLAGLTFTEHFDTHPDDWPGCVYDHEAYSTAIEGLRREFGSAIIIGKGIEVCYQPSRMDFILDFLSGHEFDLVLLSVHYFGGVAVHQRRNWEGVDAATGTRRYLENVLEAVRFCERLYNGRGRVFDVLGHLDLVKRYTKRFLGSHDVSLCSELIDEILRTLIRADIVPEVNTSTLRQNLDETMPSMATMARYAQLGGSAVTLGSDAHQPEDIGAGFDRVLDSLRSTGIRMLAAHRKRERCTVCLAQ